MRRSLYRIDLLSSLALIILLHGTLGRNVCLYPFTMDNKRRGGWSEVHLDGVVSGKVTRHLDG